MNKFIFVILLMFKTQAFAGVKINTGIENQEIVSVTTRSCNKIYVGSTLIESDCYDSIKKERVSAFKIGIGYDIEITEKFGAEANIGVNSIKNASTEINGVYKTSDKVRVKAGINASKDLGGIIENVKPGIGFQAAAEYELSDSLSLIGTLGTKSQSYQFNGQSYNDTTMNANVGISVSF